MAGLAISKVKDTIEGIFSLKVFLASLASLMATLVVSVAVYQLVFAEALVKYELTGKVMATVQVEEHNALDAAPIPPEKPAPVEPPAHPHPNENLEPVAHATETPPAPPEKPPQKIIIEDSIAGLSEETAFGSLPIIRASDKLKSFDAYKSPFVLKSETKGVISIVMIDYGLSDKLSEASIKSLPAATTLIASPYAQNLQSKISAARGKGMEIWMGLPIQGDSASPLTINIGPDAILSGLQSGQNMSRLKKHLGKATGYVGVAIPFVTDFKHSSPDLQILTNAIAARGLGIAQLDSTDTVISSSASQANAPFIQGNLWLDKDGLKNDILKSLSATEQLALNKGVVVASFHPSALNFAIIAEWQKSLAAKNIQLAPLSYAVKMNLSSPSPASHAEPDVPAE